MVETIKVYRIRDMEAMQENEEGAYRTKDGKVLIHDGENVLSLPSEMVRYSNIILLKGDGSGVIRRDESGSLYTSPLTFEDNQVINAIASYLSSSNLVVLRNVPEYVEGVLYSENGGLTARLLDLKTGEELENLEEIEERLRASIISVRRLERELKKRSNPLLQYGIPVL
ncbi:MAG: hypothetical protein DRO65_02225 [Candidatus Altiarchaeales archaeon]|nr:MAG: hypothetical protein DRO65_02225 [Candidatus Altiarchaeales archaeon]